MLRRSIAALAAFTLMAIPCVTEAQKVPPACQPLADATRKEISTPHHSYVTEAGGEGKGRTIETITVDDASYVLHNGTWRKSPIGPKEQLEMMDKALSPGTTCQRMADETVAGTPATVYHVHRESDGEKSDLQIWVAKSTGVIMKQEEDLDPGPNAGGKRHRSLRVEYTNVHAPPGAK